MGIYQTVYSHHASEISLQIYTHRREAFGLWPDTSVFPSWPTQLCRHTCWALPPMNRRIGGDRQPWGSIICSQTDSKDNLVKARVEHERWWWLTNLHSSGQERRPNLRVSTILDLQLGAGFLYTEPARRNWNSRAEQIYSIYLSGNWRITQYRNIQVHSNGILVERIHCNIHDVSYLYYSSAVITSFDLLTRVGPDWPPMEGFDSPEWTWNLSRFVLLTGCSLERDNSWLVVLLDHASPEATRYIINSGAII